MEQVTPIHEAIHSMRGMIKELELRIVELQATLPKRKKHTGPMVVTNPLTGQVLKGHLRR